MQDIAIAIAGLGGRGRYWLSMLKSVPGYRVVALCDRRQSRIDLAKEQLDDGDDVATYTSYDELLADGAVDAVALTLRGLNQGALAAQALEAGKHVSAEVPAAHSMEDCWRIVTAAERSGKVYQLAEQLRYCGFVEAWRQMIAAGELGKVQFVEGQYFHYLPHYFFADPATGELVHADEAGKRGDCIETDVHHMPPIHYLPHEISPILKMLDDRVVRVVGMGSDGPSAVHTNIRTPDLQVALMKTEKGTVIRLATSFQMPTPQAAPKASAAHWYHIKGTKGVLESPRDNGEEYTCWLAESDGENQRPRPMEVATHRDDAPQEARRSGHGGVDWYPHVHFRDAILHGKALDIDLYQAMDTAAPAILAAESIEQGSVPLGVPDFRPGPGRAAGEMPVMG